LEKLKASEWFALITLEDGGVCADPKSQGSATARDNEAGLAKQRAHAVANIGGED